MSSVPRLITWLPWDDFNDSASSLGWSDLCRQVFEAMTILNILVQQDQEHYPGQIPVGGVVTHRQLNREPVLRMWKGYEGSLAEYGIAICEEKMERDGEENMIGGGIARFFDFFDKNPSASTGKPPWFGDPDLHQSHRSMLLTRLPEDYEDTFPDTSRNMGIIWPV